VPALPAADLTPCPVLALLAAAGVTGAIGVIGIERRDLSAS
jgi:putative exporter of polyketide antibiotics